MAPSTRNYSAKTRRILDIQSLNRCAFPGCTSILVEPGIGEAGPAIVADTCHIHALSPGGARWKEGLTTKELNSIDNLILLCKNHHAVVDSQPEVYTAEQLKKWKFEHEAKAPGDFSGRDLISEILSERIRQKTSRLRQLRFFPRFDEVGFSMEFAQALIEGELSIGPGTERAPALAWCARVLSNTDHLARARECLALAKALPACEETGIADAYLSAIDNDQSDALSMLLSKESSTYRSAALELVMRMEGVHGAVEWMKGAQIKVSDLDGEGKLCFLVSCLELGDQDAARKHLDLVTREDLQETPFLVRMKAVIHLLEAVPPELHSIVRHQVPLGGKAFPLFEDPDAMKERRQARSLLLRAAGVAKELDCPDEVAADEEYALWLELMDPDEEDSSRKTLAQRLGDPESRDALRLVRLAAEFGIKLDHGAIDREIKRQVALRGGTTPVTAHARLGLALAQRSPIEVADYMSHYFQELVDHIGARVILSIQVEQFSEAGQIERARRTLEDLCSQESLSEAEEGRLRTLISEGEESDPAEAYREQFKDSDSIVDLRPLVFHLMAQKDWENLCKYARILFDKTQGLQDAERLAIALFNARKICQLAEFLESIDGTLRARSARLRLLLCWTLYHQGEIRQAREKMAVLEPEWDDPAYRGLYESLAITSGDWNSLSTMIEKDWSDRDERSGQDLIRAAQLAAHLSLPHARGLLFAAEAKGEDDPAVLATAYLLAARMGLEGEEEKVSEWIERAVSISGEDGPLKRIGLESFLAEKSEWDRKGSDIGQLVDRGKVPLFLAGQSLNSSLVELMVPPAVRNPQEKDPRMRRLVPAYFGGRGEVERVLGKSAGFDASALLTLGHLDMLDEAFDAFEEVYLAHSTLEWLFEEKQRAVFHQPSRIRDASEVSRMVASGTLERLSVGAASDEGLSDQIGEELAQLLAEAERDGCEDGSQRLVVHPFPIHQVGSLLTEEVDLTAHGEVLVSCGGVVDRLRGQLTAQASRRAKAYLQAQERPWPTEPPIADGAVLYVASLPMTYLQHLGILEEIARAGFRIVVSPRVVSEAEQLVRYQEVSQAVVEVIERIRSAVSGGIETGRVRFCKSPDLEEGEPLEEEGGSPHPSEGLFRFGDHCEALFFDDRFLNQHARVGNAARSAPIYTTLDLVHALGGGSSDRTEEWECRTKLRRAGYFFIPVEVGELEHHLQSSPVRSGGVSETAELRAIRESILAVQMRDVLQLPQEARWLIELMRTFAQVVKNLWREDVDYAEARVRSDWIVDQMDIRRWAHCFGAEAGSDLVGTGQGAYLLLLLSAPVPCTPEMRAEYWKWAEERILAPIKEQNPELFSWMIEFQRRMISEVAAKDPYAEGEVDG